LTGISLTEKEMNQIDELGKTNSIKICWDPKEIVWDSKVKLLIKILV